MMTGNNKMSEAFQNVFAILFSNVITYLSFKIMNA